MDKEKKCTEAIEVFFRMLNQFNEFEKKPLKFNNEQLIYPSEVNALCIINNNSNSNITELAQKLGVTKSAASQVIRKLEKKEIIERGSSHNHKEVFLKLTHSGHNILEQQLKKCSLRDCNIKQILNELEDEQMDLFIKVFNNFYEIIRNQLKN